MTANTKPTSGTLLGRMVTERLNQLGVSRRQFCITNNISRQTLYEIERGKVQLHATTLRALDEGLHWEQGTAYRYSVGDRNARNLNEPNERVHEYIHRIFQSLAGMTIEELEREAIWLEEEIATRVVSKGRAHQASSPVRDLMLRYLKELHAPKGETTD